MKKKIFLPLVFLIAISNSFLNAQILFFQDFSESNNVSEYIDANPGTTYFDQIFTVPNIPDTVLQLSILNQEFVMNRNAGLGSCGLGRYTDLSPVIETMLFEFSINPIEILASNFQPFKFYVGSGFANNLINPFDNQVHTKVSFHFVENEGLRLYDVTGNVGFATVISEKTLIKFYINNSSSLLDYLGPDGQIHTVSVDKIDVWQGSLLAFDEMSATTASQTLTDFKFYFNGSSGTIGLDNIRIGSIPPLSPSDSCNSVFTHAITNCNTLNAVHIPTNVNNTLNWDFGDNTTSTIANPVHEFTTAGTYNVCLQVSGDCETSTTCNSILIEDPATLILPLTINGDLNLCPGESVTFTNNSNFTNIEWSNGSTDNSITVSEPATIQATATTANGCIVNSENFIVLLDNTTIENPVIIEPAGEINVCSNELVTLTASQGYASYVWSNGATGLSIEISESGTYTVEASSSNNCISISAPTVVNFNELPSASFSYTQPDNSYNIQFENLSSPNSSYLWNFGGNNTSTQENPVFTFPFDGIYPVTLIVSNACGNDTISLDVEVLKLNVSDINLTEVKVFPNPAKDILNVSFSNKTNNSFEISVYNALGQQIFPLINRKQSQIIIDISELSNGVYFIQINKQNEQIINKKVIINR